MAAPIQEYLIGLGFKLDTPGAKRFAETLDGTAKSFVKVGEAAVAASAAVGLAVEKIASNYEDLYYLSQRTGATIQSLQATAYGFTQIGLSAGDAKGMVDNLAMALRTNPGNSALLRMLGVGGGDANTQAHDLVRNLSRMPFFMASQYAGMFGISPQQLLMMENGLGDLDRAEADHIRRQKEAGISTEDLGIKSHKFMTELRTLEDEFGILETKIGQDFINPATTFVDQLEVMLKEILRIDTATGGWVTTIGSLVASFAALRVAGAALAGVAGVFGAGAGAKAAIARASGAGLLGLAMRAGTNPLALIGALEIIHADQKSGNTLRDSIRTTLHDAFGWDLADPGQPGGAAPSSSPYGDMSDVTFGRPGATNTSGRMAFSRGVQNFNPGNIAWGPWAAAHGATGGMGLDSGHFVAVFPDYATGTEAQRQLLLSKYNAGRTNAAALIAAPGGYTPGNMGAATNVAPGGDPYADLNLNDPEAMERFQRALITQEVGTGGARYIFGHGGAPLGSEGGRGGDNIHIAPNFTTHVHGGADPQTTADYVLKGNLGMWQDVFRDAGTTVR